MVERPATHVGDVGSHVRLFFSDRYLEVGLDDEITENQKDNSISFGGGEGIDAVFYPTPELERLKLG
jgi:hypothetical protein